MDDGFTYHIKLPIYEGPLDLLLHLININEIDIYNIPIAQITSEYLEYISIMRELNLELASEFLLMAATLIYIKSKMLLPRPPEEIEEDELDPRAELMDLLLEHQRFKKSAELLKDRGKERQQIWTRTSPEREDMDEGAKTHDVSLFDLITAMRKVLKQREKTEPITLRKKDYSLEEKIKELMEILTEKKKLIFSSFFLKLKSKIEVIFYFLALLEIVRRGVVKIHQEKPLGKIVIAKINRCNSPGEEKSLLSGDRK